MPGAQRWQPLVRNQRYRDRKRAGKMRVITEGDSWFDYPPHLNIIDFLDDRDEFALLRFERSGDTVENMAASDNLSRLKEAVRKEKPVCVLLSGGGNDLFTPLPGDANRRWIYTTVRNYNPAATARDHIVSNVWDLKLSAIRTGYLHLISQLGPLAPILSHGYDYLVPSTRQVQYDGFHLAGPWIKPAMKERGIAGQEMQTAIIRELMEDFNAMMAGLQQSYPHSFLYLDLRNAIDPASDWHNEIHPTQAAFERISDRFYEAIQTRLPAVLAKRAALEPGDLP